MGFWTGEFVDGGYQPSNVFTWLRPDTSGNALNGLGDTKKPKYTPLHMHDRTNAHPWKKVQEWFYFREAFDPVAFRDILSMNIRRIRLQKYLKKKEAVASERIEKPATEWTELVRTYMLKNTKAEGFGVTDLTEDVQFGQVRDQYDLSDPHVIILVQRMDYDMLSAGAKEEPANTGFFSSKFTQVVRTVYRTYRESYEAADTLAAWIRSQGYKAAPYGGATTGPFSYIPLAIRAGLGELGKHGSLIHPELGAGIRLSAVITNMPLVKDTPRRSGIDEFCQSCQLCQSACPGGAISKDKQLVRGETRWYVDFDKCIPIFAERRGCGICLAVCPWARPGVAMNLAKKMLKKIQATMATPHQS